MTFTFLVLPTVPFPGGQTQGQVDDLGAYHTYVELTDELSDLAEAHPDIIALHSLGKTYEGRDIWAVELTDRPGTEEAGELGILIMGGHHARELISVEVPLGMLVELVEGYGKDGLFTGVVNSFRMWFVPMVNPDGHVYVEQGNDWRKNRRPNGDGTFGVDLNRNYGHLWGEGSVHLTSDEMYCGPSAFSENETRAIRSLVENNTIDMSFSYHSKGGYILFPWGNEIDDPDERDPLLEDLAFIFQLAMPTNYMAMMAADFYPATGDSDDWLFAEHGVYAYTVELTPGHRPDEGLIPGLVDQNLDGAMETMMYLLSWGAGDLGLRLPYDVYDPSVGYQGVVDHPTDIVFDVLGFSLDPWVIQIGFDITREGAPYWAGTQYFYNAVGRVVFPFIPTEVGTYEMVLELPYEDVMQEDDSITIKVVVKEAVDAGSACRFNVIPYENEWDKAIQDVTVDPRYGGVLGLSFENRETYSVKVGLEIFLGTDNLTVSLDMTELTVMALDHGFFSMSLKARAGLGPGFSGYLVLKVSVSGILCKGTDLVSVRTYVKEHHDVLVGDLDIKVDRRGTEQGYLLFKNDGNVDERLNLSSTDTSILRPVQGSVVLAPGDEVLVPVKVKGVADGVTRRILVKNDEVDVAGVVNVELREKDENVPIGVEVLVLGMALAGLIYGRRRG